MFGGERRVCICRELTKMHESICQLPLKEAVDFVRDGVKKGEFTLVLEGKKEYCERVKEELNGEKREESGKGKMKRATGVFGQRGVRSKVKVNRGCCVCCQKVFS